MTLRPLTQSDMQVIREWRHGVPETLRTPYMLTAEMQDEYYRTVICNRDSKTRYWALWDEELIIDYNVDWGDISNEELIGYGGIENISWENGTGEMSVLIRPDMRGHGYGKCAVHMFLEQAFDFMRLGVVYGECYYCGPVAFWKKIAERYDAYSAVLPKRKYWDGQYWYSYYFSIDRFMWESKGAE